VTLRWGAFVPQGWKLELAGMGAADAWAKAKEIALRAEDLGYDHLWVYDTSRPCRAVSPSPASRRGR